MAALQRAISHADADVRTAALFATLKADAKGASSQARSAALARLRRSRTRAAALRRCPLPPRLSPRTSLTSISKCWIPAVMLSWCLRLTASRMYSGALATASAQMACSWAATSCGTLTLQYSSSVDCVDASSVCRISGADVPRKSCPMPCMFVSAPGCRSSSMAATSRDSAYASVLGMST